MGSKVLLIEDNASIRDLISLVLSSEGYEVVQSKNGKDGLAQAKEVQPDLMILDLMMPDLSGESVIHELRKDARLRSVPVIVVTGKDEALGRIKDLIGDGNVFHKPFEPAALLGRVTELIGPAE